MPPPQPQQEAALVGVHVRVEELPETIVTGLAEKARVGAGQLLSGGGVEEQEPLHCQVPFDCV